MKGKKVKVVLSGSPYFGMTGWVVMELVKTISGVPIYKVDFRNSVAVFTSNALMVVDRRKARKDDRKAK